jgi:cytochrome b involved in lipid metabolism
MSTFTSALTKALLIPIALSVALTIGFAGPTQSSAATPTAVASPTAVATATIHPTAVKHYTMATVKKHNKKTNCWTVVGKNVYKLTKYIKKHPGGAKRIVAMCGKNATAAFRNQHGSTGKAAAALKKYKIGVLA